VELLTGENQPSVAVFSNLIHNLYWQVPPDSIRATLCALGPQLELPAALRTLPPAPVGLPGAVVSNGAGAHNPWPPAPRSTYALRAVVCYFGHHYLAFALSEVRREMHTAKCRMGTGAAMSWALACPA
jgi:hypothetical protein